MKKILFFFPENPLEKNSGNKTRVLQLLDYFRKRNAEVDFVSVSPWTSVWSEKDAAGLRESGLVRQVHILSRKPSKKNLLRYLLSYKPHQLAYEKETARGKSALPVHSNYHIQIAFEQLLEKTRYDYILISYVYWHHLIRNKTLTGEAKTIIDTHDFITVQMLDAEASNLGATFEDEMERLSLFDEVWAISPEEQYIFSQFCDRKVRLVPLMLAGPADDSGQDGKSPDPDGNGARPAPAAAPATATTTAAAANRTAGQREYDLIYVASDNPHNVRAARWFFDEVYPRLPGHLVLCVIGKITAHIGEYGNVIKVPFAENLGHFYSRSSIAVCPMFSGTGLKVKVVEALSYGLPVVCTQKGTDGLPNKSRNGCLVSDEPGQFAQNIVSLLQDPSLYAQQSGMGKTLFSSFFSLEKGYQTLDEAFGSQG